MSTPSHNRDSSELDLEMTDSPAFDHTPSSLDYIITHVFLPVKLPDANDYSPENELSLARAVCAAAHAYTTPVINRTAEPQWNRITKMLDDLRASIESDHLDSGHVTSRLRGMRAGDVLVFFIRPQNAALVLTKRESCTLYESFEVSPRKVAVEMTGGSLICSYPTSAVEISNEVFDDGDFQFELANFLSRPDAVDSDLPRPPHAQPQYITALLTGIMRGVGCTADVPRIIKRVRDHVGKRRWSKAISGFTNVWRRSSLWLLIRVAIQISVDRSSLGRASYKGFMLFFICTLARDRNNADLSSDLLYLISSKILRRLTKLGSSTADWLSEMALQTCAYVQNILDSRLKPLHIRPSPFRNPSQDELVRDTQLSLLDSREYIRNALAGPGQKHVDTHFHPSHRQRGTLDDFLSSNGSFFEDAYHADSDVTLYDVERLVEQGIDDWMTCVTNVGEACVQLEILMDKYMAKANRNYGKDNPEDISRMLLTAVELFVALDKLVMEEIPMLVDYSPEFPTASLESLFLRNTTGLHRLSRAYQYLSMRERGSRPGWSILSNDFTENSFAVRYYDQSPRLQQLRARIEEGATKKVTGHANLQWEGAGPTCTSDGYQACQQQLSIRRLAGDAEAPQSPLPASLLQAKVVVFELRCPACIRIWRSAASRIMHYFSDSILEHGSRGAEKEANLLEHFPALDLYFIGRKGPRLTIEIQFVFFYPLSSQSPLMRYVIRHPDFNEESPDLLSIWRLTTYRYMQSESGDFPGATFLIDLFASNLDGTNMLRSHLKPPFLMECVAFTTYTSNDILSTLSRCPVDFPLDEFTAFVQLRSGGLLQWLNILQGLRSRTLNFRRREVHYLLAHAVFQVGPLDLNTGVWIWHQELQDSLFCNTFLEELEDLFADVGASSIDGVMMNTISLLLTRVLASSPSEGVSERALALLREVRRKIFDWVQELLYNLVKAPVNEERSDLLRDMAATCRSTFNVGSATLHRFLHCAEDVDVVLSCALLIHALHPESVFDGYSQLLLKRDRHLTFALEGTLGTAIFSDPSDYGVDLAIRKVFASHQPGIRRWEQLQSQNTRWLTCKTKVNEDRQASHAVHLNLLDGTLRVDGQLLGGLPHVIRHSPILRRIFRDQSFFVAPSNLPGMDFTTLTMMSKYKIHFSLRGGYLVLRAQCNATGNILELIPSSILRKDIPSALVRNHVHWLNLTTKSIEIRALEQLWEESSENWRIDCASGKYRMSKGRETLVDIRSPTWEMVSKCFECLNGSVNETRKSQSDGLLITTSPINPARPARGLCLYVTLPRYSLSFFVNELEELESRDFKDMVYDENQSVGAVFGLEDLLVLRQKTHLPEDLLPRRVLVRNGILRTHGDGWFQTRSDMYSSGDDRSSYHTYDVDTELGCLIGDGSLTSTHYLSGLHSMTSYHRPDPLTGKTGAQAALHLLQSARCQSVMKLKALDSKSFRTSSRYPQIVVAGREIQQRYYWDRQAHDITENIRASEKRGARRAAYLFPPSAAIRSNSPEDRDDTDYSPAETDLELEDVVFTAASVAHRLSRVNALTMSTISDWAELLSVDTLAENSASSSSLRDGPVVRSHADLMQTLDMRAHDILEEGTRHQFQFLFLLPTMAYCSPNYQAAFLSMLIAFAKRVQAHFGDLSIICANYKICDGYRPTEEVLWCQIRRFRLFQLEDSVPEGDAVKQLLKDWLFHTPPAIGSLLSGAWDTAGLTASLQRLFSSCSRNLNLKERLICILTEPGFTTLPRPISRHMINEHTSWQITLEQLLFNPGRSPPELPSRVTLPHDMHKRNKVSSSEIPKLDQLLSSIAGTGPSFRQEYIAQLNISAQRAREESRMTRTVAEKSLVEPLIKHYMHCRVKYMDSLAALKQSLGPTTNPLQQALSRSGQWPPITADYLLQCLSSTSPISLPARWKKCLISLALLLLDLQHSRRLVRYALDGLEEEFFQELENKGCDGWNPEEYPDWLLIQIQGNFLIRRVQAEIAMEIISPQSGENTVIQVNMGEGKSSVIIPIAAAALADGNQLVRVVVPKELTVQMFELLTSRLGGLANKPIYHLPFSRAPEYDSLSGNVISLQTDDLRKAMSRCMAERGILLVQPEHIMSLKLISVTEQIRGGKLVASLLPKLYQSIYKHVRAALSLGSFAGDSLAGNMFRWSGQSSNHSIKESGSLAKHRDKNSGDSDPQCISDSASKWLSLQKWIDSHARDILDESDQILHARFQLIYTIGLQQHIDGYPDRWTITQQVLRLVKERAHTLSQNHPNSLEYKHGPPGSFPHVRIAQGADAGKHLISLILEDVMAGRLPGFNFQYVSPTLHNAIRSFISDEDVLQVPHTPKMVEEYARSSHQSHLWSGLLLLRGLLASNILLFSLSGRRWCVDYGLLPQSQHLEYSDDSSTPTMLAVPYRAKGVPAPNTQFGHPDTTIILTCLSYYYAGLSEEQLRFSFETLLHEDDPSTEYALWVREYDCDSIPDSLQKLGEINLKPSEQWDNVVFPLFNRNQEAINFYLSRVVFPREAKEFPWKLSGSSWDLAEKREKLITGFSGTNDTRWLLPMSIAQRDLDQQQGTNARVIAYLLQPENGLYMVTDQSGEQQTTPEFLQMVTTQQPQIRVLIDVGAQILDFSNLQVANAWLDIARDANGAIYFNESDELMVLTRNGVVQTMLSSPLSQQLDRCVVYMDHAHTRGTDLKLPIGSRAAVTLGPNITKDHIVQGCMRMRKLGYGHSVMFFASREVDRSIRAVAAKTNLDTQVTTVDILHWAIRETWSDIQRRAPYWAQQGMDHKSRYEAWTHFCGDDLSPEQLSNAWLQPEHKSLAGLYAPCVSNSFSSTLSELDPGIRQHCKALGVLSLPSAQMEEEQEREVNREKEREREVELPTGAEPAKHFLHQDVVTFVTTGIIPSLHSNSAFRPIFTTLEKSSAPTPEADVWSPFILATVDFCNTIKLDSTRGSSDQYLRPVQWILSRKKDPQLLVLLSPFEANCLMPVIRLSEYVHLHLYAPRTSQRMKPSDDLKLYAIPPLPSDWTPPWALIDQLNIFAGQLYLRDYASYLRLCRFLDIPTKDLLDGTAVRRNLFNIPGSFEENEITFSGSPLPSVMALLSIRSRGRPFAHTHMGRILQGQLLTENDFLRTPRGGS